MENGRRGAVALRRIEDLEANTKLRRTSLAERAHAVPERLQLYWGFDLREFSHPLAEVAERQTR